jgi:hypothetical protein
MPIAEGSLLIICAVCSTKIFSENFTFILISVENLTAIKHLKKQQTNNKTIFFQWNKILLLVEANSINIT